MVKPPKISFTDDEVREAILKFLYEKWKNPRGMDSAKLKITDIKKALKIKGMEQAEVIRNLQYVISTKWVEKIVKNSTYNTGNRTIPTEEISYMITSQGIEYFEGSSRFSKKEETVGIRIENINGITIIGNNNIVHNEYISLFKSLEELKNKIAITDELTDADKLEYQADVNTIQSQLSKPNPDKNIIDRAYERIKGIGKIASLVAPIANVGISIAQLFQG